MTDHNTPAQFIQGSAPKRTALKTLLHFLKPYKVLAFITVVTLMCDVAGSLFLPTILADIINIGVSTGDMDYILQKGALMLGAALLSALGALAGSYLCARLASNIGRDIRNAIYDKSLSFSSADFEQFGTGSMITRSLNDINVIQSALMMTTMIVLPVPIMCVMGVLLAFSIDTHMGTLLLIMVSIVLVFAIIIVKKAAIIFESLQRFIDRMNTVLRENITGVRVIRAFNKEKHEEKRLHKSFSDYAYSAIKVNWLFASLDSLSFLCMNVAEVAIIWIGGNRVAEHAMEIGSISALIEYAILILFYIMMAQMVALMIPRAFVCLRRTSEVLGVTPEIADPPSATCMNDVTPNKAHLSETQTISAVCNQPEITMESSEEVARFNHATFRFADADEDTLHDLNFACLRGKTTAIIGSTGSGKSTIAKLLLRFHDATQGNVLLNGCDVRAMTQQDLRKAISYVPQKAWLFSGTIADNLRYGNPQATEADMHHALAIAQASFVDELDGGIRARVAQGGTNFSGGQKQRLAIARALMKPADLYLFDDSFSALDFKTDAALRAALASETHHAAVVIIAQRVSTILHADQIVVLEDGAIAGIGTHDELMASCATYQDIVASQIQGGE